MRMHAIVLILSLLVAGAAAERPAAQETLNDAQVMALFDEANTTDIWVARLALGRAQSADVRKLAEMVIADHEAVQHMARELAKKLKVAATPPSSDTSATTLARAIRELQGKSGAEFDRAYLAHELAFHRTAIDVVRGTLLPAATHPELKALLNNVLGGFEHHLAETRTVAVQLGVK